MTKLDIFNLESPKKYSLSVPRSNVQHALVMITECSYIHSTLNQNDDVAVLTMMY